MDCSERRRRIVESANEYFDNLNTKGISGNFCVICLIGELFNGCITCYTTHHMTRTGKYLERFFTGSINYSPQQKL
jgi:hypothetical protein